MLCNERGEGTTKEDYQIPPAPCKNIDTGYGRRADRVGAKTWPNAPSTDSARPVIDTVARARRACAYDAGNEDDVRYRIADHSRTAKILDW